MTYGHAAARPPTFGQALVTVPSRVLLEQFSEEIPGFCKVGMGYNDKIDFSCRGFISVTDSVRLLQKLEFEACFVDEGHHPLPPGMPRCKELFQFSATHKEEVDFRYSLGEAIEEGVLCDYDLTVPVTTEGHPYICLANLLLSQAGRFRRVLAYCNSIAEAKKFRHVLETVGLAAWHINGKTNRAERERVMNEFARELSKPLHVLVTVQVLGEGVNIPNADTCMFVEPRSSYVSIIQAIGRVLRPDPSNPMAHIVLPAVAMPAMSKTFTMAPPPGSSGLTGSAESMLRARGSEKHVQPSESEATMTKARRGEPPQNELLASGDGAQTAGLWDDGCADCRADSSSPMNRAEVGLKGRSEGSNANRPWPCDPRSHRTTTDDRQGAELGRPDRPAPTIPIATVSDEDALIAPIGSAASVAAAPAIGDRQVGESVSQPKPASLAQGDDVNSFTAPMPAGTVAAKDGALACKCAGKVKQRKTSWDAAARGRSGARRDSESNRKDRSCAGGRPTAGLRAQGSRDYYPLSEPLAESSRGGNAKKTECSGPSSQNPMTDGQQHSGLRAPPASGTSVTPAGTFSEQEPGSSSRELSAAAPAQVAHVGHSTEALILMANQGTGAGPSTKEFPAKLMRRRASKLKVKTADDAGLFGSGRADQLDRFLEAIAQADSRFADKDMRLLQSRLWVTDCRLQQPIMQQLLARDVQYQLALILQQRDAFDLRLQAVEKFDQDHRRLPRQRSSQIEERTLAIWLQNLCTRQKRKMLSAQRMQKLLNSSSSRLRARAAKWLQRSVSFKEWLEELRQFVHAHNRMPDRRRDRSIAEQHLLQRAKNLVNPTNRNYERRLQLLEKIGPVPADWVKSRRMRRVRVDEARWNRQFDSLLEFVEANDRLPTQTLERFLYCWVGRQRRQLNYLPAELRAKLLDSHPVIAAFLQS